MLITLFITAIILVMCVLLLSVKIIFKKNGTFPNTHVGGNKALAKRGITCSKTQNREQIEHRNLYDRMKEIKEVI